MKNNRAKDSPARKLCIWLIACIWLAAIATIVKAGDSTSNYKSRTELTIAVIEFPPYEYSDGGNIDGITVRIVREAFLRMGYVIKLEMLPWSRALNAVQTGRIDGVFQLLKRHERETYILYSNEVLMKEAVVAFTLPGRQVNYDGTVESLSDRALGVRQDFSYGLEFDQAREQGVLRKVVSSVSPQTLLKLLYEEKIELMIGDHYTVPHLHQQLYPQQPALQALSPSITKNDSYFGFTRSRHPLQLRDKFDRTLKTMKEEGSYHRIIERWRQETRDQKRISDDKE